MEGGNTIMSGNVDERIVQMRFDNKQFEAGVSTSIKSIDNLKDSLKFEGATKGLSDLESAGRRFSLASIGQSVDAIASKFSTLSIIGITALQNLTNSAINAAKRMVSAFTVEPITAGFREYELKMGSIQTILANTQSHAKKVSQDAMAGINEKASASGAAAQKANKGALESLRKTQAEQVKVYNKAASEEMKILTKKYEAETEALENAIDEQNQKLRESHNAKLKMYNEEYMQKLKALDEERYNKLKAIEDEIASINGQTQAEEDASTKTMKQNRLQELQQRIDSAKTLWQRSAAEKDLAAYKAELSREQAMADRKAQIDNLNQQKEGIDKQYDALEDKLRTEYDAKVEQENKLYDETAIILKKQQEAQIKSLNEVHEAGREQLKERQDNELDAIRERQSAEMDAMQARQEAALSNISKRKDAELAALYDVKTEMTKASSLEDVNKALEELNDYADQTIYSFSEMTQNIGRFTAAGVELTPAVSAIKGISNLAALSGSSADKAAMAMYQLSQALASGKMKYQDWISVNNAGMGGTVFQDSLKETARVHGIAVDQIIAKEGSFQESLSKGWLTAEILTETLSKFTGDLTEDQLKSMGYTDDQIAGIIKLGQTAFDAATKVKTFTQLVGTLKEAAGSGWATSWELMIGNFDEAKALFTELGDTLGGFVKNSADARNAMLKFWKDNGGRAMLVQAITNAFHGLEAILKPIHEAFREIFPPATGKILLDLSKTILNVSEKFKIGETAAANIKATFKGLFSVVDIGVKAIKLLANGVKQLIKTLLPSSESFLAVTASIGNFLTSVNESIEANDLMGQGLEKIGVAFTFVKDAIKKASDIVKPALASIKKMFEDLFGGTTAYAATLTDSGDAIASTTTLTDKLRLAFEKLGGWVDKIRTAFLSATKTIKKIFAPILTFIKEKLGELSLQDVGALLTGSGFLMLARSISKGVTSFSKVLDELGNAIKSFQLKVKAEALLKIAIALAVLAGALIALSFIDLVDLAKSLGILTVVFGELVAGLIVINKYVKDVKKVTTQMIALGIGMLLLSFAVKTLASMDVAKLSQGIAALGTLMIFLAGFTKYTEGSNLKQSVAGLTGFAIGIMILAGALAILGNIDQGKLIQGGVAIAALMTAIAAFIQLTKEGDLKKSAGGLIGFALGILILTAALAVLGNMDTDKVIMGGVALATLMAVIATFIQVTDGRDLQKSAGGLMGFAIGIIILVGALAILGNMDSNKVIQGGVAIATLMAVIAKFIQVTNGADLKKSAGGLIGFAIGIGILVISLTALANLDSDRLIQGGIAISALMAVIAKFIQVTREGDLKGSAKGMMGFAVGLIVLSGAVAILAAIDPNRIVQGVVALSTLMVVIGAFIRFTKEGDLKQSAKGLAGFAAGLMILAGVIAILSALNTEKLIMASAAISALMLAIALFINFTKEGDLKASAAGLIIFSVAIAILAASLLPIARLDLGQILASAGAIVVLLAAIAAFSHLTKAGDLVASGAGLVVFSGAILVMAYALSILGKMELKSLLIAIGALAAVFLILGVSALVLTPLTPVILALSASILMLGLGCLAAGVGVLAFATGINILAETGPAGAEALKAIVMAMVELIPYALAALAVGIIAFAKVIGDGAPVIAESFMKVFTAMLDTAVQMTPKVIDAGLKLILGLLKAIGDNIQKIVEAGINVIVGFLKGIASKIGDIIDTAFKVIIAFINGLADAIDKNHIALYEAVRKLVTAIGDAIIDFIPYMVSMGSDMIKGFIEGVKSMAGALWDAAKGVVSGAVDGIKNFLGIHSPSRVFAEIGRYSMMGFADGLRKFGGLVGEAARDVGATATN
jgi:tape measure domain-containing protein